MSLTNVIQFPKKWASKLESSVTKARGIREGETGRSREEGESCAVRLSVNRLLPSFHFRCFGMEERGNKRRRRCLSLLLNPLFLLLSDERRESKQKNFKEAYGKLKPSRERGKESGRGETCRATNFHHFTDCVHGSASTTTSCTSLAFIQNSR